MSKMQKAYDRHKKMAKEKEDDKEGPPPGKKSKTMKQSKLKF